MLKVNVLLSGRLMLDGYGRGYPENHDGTILLSLPEGSTIRQVIQGLHIPLSDVSMTMINGRRCQDTDRLKSGDRVVLMPEDVAALWRALRVMNAGMGSVFSF